MNLLLPISFGLAIVLFLNNTKNVKNEIKNKNCNPRFWNIGENFEYVEKINEDESLCYLLSTKLIKLMIQKKCLDILLVKYVNLK